MARLTTLVLVFLVVGLSWLAAAQITVKSGSIDSVSPDSKTVSVKFGKAETTTEVTLAKDADVRLDGKASELNELKPGMLVTVQLGPDGEGQRILARTAKKKPSIKKKPATPRITKSTKT